MNCSKIPRAATAVAASVPRRLARRCVTMLVLSSALLRPTARAVDFRLDTVSIMFDGFPIQQPFFRYDETNAVYILLPGSGWSASGVSDSLTLTPSKLTGAQIRLEKSTSPASDTDFKGKEVLDAYRRRALASTPQGAKDVTIVAEHDLPVDFYHWRNYEFDVDYKFFGQFCRRGTMYLDLDQKQQIVVVYTALPADFDLVRSTALGVLRSWQVKPLSP